MILNPTQGLVSGVAAKTTIPASPTTTTTPPVSQTSSNQTKSSNNEIIVTTVYEEVKNLKRIGDISASASKVFGKQEN